MKSLENLIERTHLAVFLVGIATMVCGMGYELYNANRQSMIEEISQQNPQIKVNKKEYDNCAAVGEYTTLSGLSLCMLTVGITEAYEARQKRKNLKRSLDNVS
jgi:ABC-type lipoprotein release transport system permease subunit